MRKSSRAVAGLPVLVGAAALACAASGPRFELEPPPEGGFARVYVYRTTDNSYQHDYGEIISLDGQDVGRIIAVVLSVLGVLLATMGSNLLLDLFGM